MSIFETKALIKQKKNQKQNNPPPPKKTNNKNTLGCMECCFQMKYASVSCWSKSQICAVHYNAGGGGQMHVTAALPVGQELSKTPPSLLRMQGWMKKRGQSCWHGKCIERWWWWEGQLCDSRWQSPGWSFFGVEGHSTLLPLLLSEVFGQL